jgi:Mlc titration factor MtfA (ptsG expression regulator)
VREKAKRDVPLLPELAGPAHRRLNTRRERRTLNGALVFGGVAFVVATLLGGILAPTGPHRWLAVALAALVGYAVHTGMSAPVRRRRRILARPFPPEWEKVLQRDVSFFRALPEPDKARFRREIQVFVGEKRITGIKTEVDDTTRVLTAASAIIPIFGFPDWEWNQINEVLIYPDRFGEDYTFGSALDHNTLGMVGTGVMNRIMILSKPDLIQGFRNPGDKRNVGVHEFAHLVDKADGSIDGLPGVALPRDAVGPWIELVRRKMSEIEHGRSDLDPYALTNEAEFFAVASEYFFERPGVMQRRHPVVFAALSWVFNHGWGSGLGALARDLRHGRRRFGRNSPCPCGSGRKYKKCCLA